MEVIGIVTTCVDINGNELKKGSSITITSNHYGYNPISLIWDENNNTTNVRGISKDTNAYKFLFLDTLEGNNSYWIGSLIAYLGPANYGWCNYGVRVIHQGAIQSKMLSYSAVGSTPDFVDSTAEYGVRAVITLEEDTAFEYDKTNSIWKIS